MRPLIEALTGRQRACEVHVVAASGEEPARVCIHSDPTALGVSRVREITEAAGARVTERFGHLLPR